MTDLELLDKYCETCLDYVSPFLVREVSARGLIHIVNHLPRREAEAKAIVRARLAKMGKTFGDPEIDKIAGEIQRLEALRKELNQLALTDPHKVLPVLKEMQACSQFVLDYFKPVNMP